MWKRMSRKGIGIEVKEESRKIMRPREGEGEARADDAALVVAKYPDRWHR